MLLCLLEYIYLDWVIIVAQITTCQRYCANDINENMCGIKNGKNGFFNFQ